MDFVGYVLKRGRDELLVYLKNVHGPIHRPIFLWYESLLRGRNKGTFKVISAPIKSSK
jgi:hypothetical protein